MKIAKTYGIIKYVEVRDSATREVIGIIDTAQSIIWHSVYYGVGDFEVYIQLNAQTMLLLQVGNYITRTDNQECGIIEHINISNSREHGIMITASGRFAKSILDRRLIYNLSGTSNTPTILRGNVETNIRSVVKDNAIDCTDTNRNMSALELGAVAGIDKIIVDESGNAAQKQVSYQNLLEYTDGVLEEYEMSSFVALNAESQKLQYIVFEGIDRSEGNTSGNAPIIFSRDFDNLGDVDYTYDETAEKNTALIGGEGEGTERFYTLLSSGKSDLARKEMWVDASSLNKKYKDESDVEQTYTDTEYAGMLKAQGQQSMSKYNIIETMSGVIDITNGNFIYNRDFELGDIVTVQDTDIGKYINVRIREITEVQDENGYTIEAIYE